MQQYELPQDRLATTDEHGNRVYLYPADVRGKWRKRRSLLSIFLLAIFLGMPWIKIGGHQALLLDISHRRFAIFGLTFWAHDAPLLVFIFGGLAISIAFVTAVWGRFWCGWACPQTVFIEHLFRRIERWIEGSHAARRSLDAAPWSSQKIVKKSTKWILFVLAALVISHSFLAYFVGTEALAEKLHHSPLNDLWLFSAMLFITALLLFDFGWFREQFCVVACPYGRFQSVLMDSQTTVIVYDMKRGEPRRGQVPSVVPQGDCVNCYRCVQVCPTGVDIRRGVQLECVACTACIDACDEVMDRLQKPRGLIRYGSAAEIEGSKQARVPWYEKTRAIIYGLILVFCLGGLAFTVAQRSPIEWTMIRAVESPYQEIADADGRAVIVNHFKVDLRNQTFAEQEINFYLEPELVERGAKLIISNHKNPFAPGAPERADIFVQFPKEILTAGRATRGILLEAKTVGDGAIHSARKEMQLVGPQL